MDQKRNDARIGSTARVDVAAAGFTRGFHAVDPVGVYNGTRRGKARLVARVIAGTPRPIFANASDIGGVARAIHDGMGNRHRLVENNSVGTGCLLPSFLLFLFLLVLVFDCFRTRHVAWSVFLAQPIGGATGCGWIDLVGGVLRFAPFLHRGFAAFRIDAGNFHPERPDFGARYFHVGGGIGCLANRNAVFVEGDAFQTGLCQGRGAPAV
mmetsp:Transcript_5368/g.11826  ORF Transcript_5368/g.11826 Transcript_5368/m.11826 type:complete len:210 (-) Transcript_5368:24-653(-)